MNFNSLVVLVAYVIVALWAIKRIVRWGIAPTLRHRRDRRQVRREPICGSVWDDDDAAWLAMYRIDLTRVADDRETS